MEFSDLVNKIKQIIRFLSMMFNLYVLAPVRDCILKKGVIVGVCGAMVTFGKEYASACIIVS